VTITITRRLEIDAGHRLMNHESKCRNAHGHRYVFEIEVTALSLDTIGRVIDFSVIKTELGGWLDRNWDHGFLYQKGDPIQTFLNEYAQKGYEMETTPTAENMALEFLGVARELMARHEIQVVSVKLWETPNCFAYVR